MICPDCSSEMPEISSYCPGCGRSIHGESELPRAGDTTEAVLGALAYFTIIPAVVLLAVPQFRGKAFLRFHAWQSILFVIATTVIGLAMRLFVAILSLVPFIGFLFAWLSVGLVFLAFVVLWAVLVVKAGQGQGYELPWLGHFAYRLAR
jgi:uncharacterized membrane protein